MEYDSDAQVLNFVSGLVLGAVIGAGIALLMAPEPGRRTRRRIQKGAEALGTQVTDRWDELADDVKERVDQAVKGARKRLS